MIFNVNGKEFDTEKCMHTVCELTLSGLGKIVMDETGGMFVDTTRDCIAVVHAGDKYYTFTVPEEKYNSVFRTFLEDVFVPHKDSFVHFYPDYCEEAEEYEDDFFDAVG